MQVETPKSVFETLVAIDVAKHIEKKGKFAYLSWSYAVRHLLSIYPDADWDVVEFDGLPYLKTETGFFVKTQVTVNGITRKQWHPVLNEKNSVIAAPTAFQINTSIQRCLTKCIGLHGLGLYIYNGEDMPGDISVINNDETPEVAELIGGYLTEIAEATTRDGIKAILGSYIAAAKEGGWRTADTDKTVQEACSTRSGALQAAAPPAKAEAEPAKAKAAPKKLDLPDDPKEAAALLQAEMNKRDLATQP